MALACDLGVFDATERRRYDALRAELARVRRGVREEPDGYSLLYPADRALFLGLAEFVTLERRCCPFLTFALEFGQAGAPIRLTVSGGEGVKEFLRASLPAGGA